MTDQTPNTSADAPKTPADAQKSPAPASKKKASAKSRSNRPAASKQAGATADAPTTEKRPSAAAKTADAARTQAPAGNGKPPAPTQKSAGGRNTAALIVLFVLVLGLAAGGVVLFNQSNQSSQSLAQLQSEQSGVLDQARQSGQQAQQQADKALEALTEQETTLQQQASELASLKQALSETQSQLKELNQAYQRLTDRGSDLVLLNDVENLVTIAQQQLQLGGNVANAIMSLETAQAQLARAGRPAMATLLQTINGDLDRLRATRVMDMASVSAKLDELADLVLTAPLLIPDDAAPHIESGLATGAEAGTASPEGVETPASEVKERSTDSDAVQVVWWQRALQQAQSWAGGAASVMRNDIDRFVSVRRVDDATALFISPDQASRFRDHLRLRVMTAQMALIIGRTSVWEAETTALQQAIEGRFDESSALSRKALRIAREMVDTEIEVKLPNVDNSIQALEALREPDADADSIE